tara:strand:- start:1044 stop:1742 length:699 start_codon:yes stop_codon:yes gene_type:complete
MNKILVFTATYNEVNNVENLINSINRYNNNLDILIIDDNSPDGTSKLINELKKIHSNINLITRDGKQGLDTAHKFAYEYALKKGYSKLITMDADLSHNPGDINKISDLLDNNPFVIGSRYTSGGKCEMNFLRWVLSYFGNKFIKIMLNINSSEFTTSFRGFELIKLKNFHLQNVNSKGYSFFMETIFLINKLGYKIVEFPIIFSERKYGKSKIPKIELFRTLKNVIFLKFSK